MEGGVKMEFGRPPKKGGGGGELDTVSFFGKKRRSDTFEPNFLI